VEEWFSAFGPEQTDQLAAALNQPAPTTIRVNTLQTSIDQCQRELSLEGVETSRTEFSPHGLVLKKRTNIRALRTFKRGWFELQDEGSQILSFLVEPKPGETIVDACAGGGGKALHLAALMENKGV
jgi:16S rRNA (cytosine967-C5)-methyltransferase